LQKPIDERHEIVYNNNCQEARETKNLPNMKGRYQP